MSIDEEKVTDSEWGRRILCSDESCIGVIGADGRCKECGRRFEGELPTALAETPATGEGEQSPARQASSALVDRHASEEDQIVPDEEWERRRLCDDGNCIGTIGPDNRCTVCRKATEHSLP